MTDKGHWDRQGKSVVQRHLRGDVSGLLPSGCLLIETELIMIWQLIEHISAESGGGGQFLSPWSHEGGRLTNACYNPDCENGGCPSLGHHGFRDRVLAQRGLTAGVKDEEESAGGGGRG